MVAVGMIPCFIWSFMNVGMLHVMYASLELCIYFITIHLRYIARSVARNFGKKRSLLVVSKASIM